LRCANARGTVTAPAAFVSPKDLLLSSAVISSTAHQQLARALVRSARWSIALASACAAVALFGWIAQIDVLMRFVPEWPLARPASIVTTLMTAGALALVLSSTPSARGWGQLMLAITALCVLTAMLLPDAALLPGGGLYAYTGSALLLIIAAGALALSPFEKHRAAVRLLGASSAALLFIALFGISFRLLLDLEPLVEISLPTLLALLLLTHAVIVMRPDEWVLEHLTSSRPGVVITRRLLPSALLVPLLIGWLEIAAEGASIVDSAFGEVLQIVATMVALAVLILWGARRLERADAQRSEAELAMRHAYAELDQRVADRTAALERANVALHDSLALLRGVAESTPDLIVVKDSHGRVVMANPAQVKAVGKAEAAIIGRTDREFMDDAALADRIMANDRRVMSSSRVERVEETVATHEGARTYLSTKSPLRDVHGQVVGVIGVATDITDRKRMENELREAQRFTQGLVETAPIVLYLYDRVERRIVYATGMGLEALGLSPEDLTSRDAAGLESLIHAEDLPTVVDSLRRGPVVHGSIREVEFRCRTQAGEWRWMHGRERDFEQVDENRLLLGVMVDITDRKVAELERERLMSQEQKLRLEAERANRAKDEFLAIVSHELRSPLNALRGWGFLLGSAKAPDAALVDRATQAIKRNVDHQARLIDDLLDTSRIMSGKLNIERRPVHLAEVLTTAIEVVKPSAVAKRIELTYEPANPSLAVEGDAARLNQIVVNLISNAVKFTPEAGAVTITLVAAGGMARIDVSDTGAGIDPEFLPRVFERFTQADTSTTRRHGGLGIGLALVRHLTELHGGRVHAHSEGVGKGSKFTVELPLPRVQPRETRAEPGRSSIAAVGGLAGMRIYTLDDDPDARDVISLTLRQAGAEVRALSSGAELIAALDGQLPESAPDVLLLDLAMPDEDGFTVLARVRALEASKAARFPTPAIAVTAFTEVSRARVMERGFTDHVSKPIEPSKLAASIRRAVVHARDRQREDSTL
jgi:PAS domain S-box-containing protein